MSVGSFVGVMVVDDMYNVNFDLMCVVIDVFVVYLVLCVLVIGDMGEVGDEGLVFYCEIGVYVCECGIDVLFVFGDVLCDVCMVYGDIVCYFDDVGVFVLVLFVVGYGV